VHSGTAVMVSRVLDRLLSAVPVWAWTAAMSLVARGQTRRFNRHPVPGVVRSADIDYVGDGSTEHHLDVLRPVVAPPAASPVYVYFHGGGWTSGDKAALTKYCASQAASGLVVVNANYRLAIRRDGYRMAHMVEDANRVLAWVRAHAAEHGGDPERIVVGGDSAGGQIAALVVAVATRPELADHFGVTPAVQRCHLRGVIQHCSFADADLALRRWSLVGSGFVRMLLPAGARGLRGAAFRDAARFLSPVEWVSPEFPETLVTTSARDFLHRASVTLVDRLQGHGVPVESLILERAERRARHTWQQDAALPESQAVYRLLQTFVHRVTATSATA
jgi:acetyl esterase